MSFSKIATVSVALALVTKVAAHGIVSGIVADGVYYEGYSANFQYMATPPVVVGWSTPQDQSLGPITPDAYATSDIICHLGATNAGASATVAAGGTVDLQWTVWPESHHGPVIDYLANCNGDCTTVDKTALEFFKIDGVGLIDDTTVPGEWASDQLIANNNTWSLTIPSDIAPGSYVLRHEIIALHSAGEANGAQNYPQCFNLEITGSGTLAPSGTLGTALYTATDAGILVNIYTALTSYLVPGPALYSGASSGSSSAVVSSAKPSSTQASAIAAVTKAASSAKSSSAAGITAPAGAIASGSPYSNSTSSKTKKSKSACKVKTSGSVPVASAKINAITSSLEEQATTVTIPTTSITQASSSKATSTKTPSSGGSTSTSPNPSTSSSASSSTSAPEGTTLSTLLSWVSSFYTKHADSEYTGSTVARRQHARDVVPGNHEGGFAAASGFAAPSGGRQGHAHGSGAHSAGFPRPTGSFSKGSFSKGAAGPSGFPVQSGSFGDFPQGGPEPTGALFGRQNRVKGTGVQSGAAKATGHHGHHGHGTGAASAGFPQPTGSFSKGNAKPSGDALEVRKVKGTGVQSGAAQATGKHHGHHGHGSGVASAGFPRPTGTFSQGSAKPSGAVEARQNKVKGTGVQSGSPQPTGHGRPHGTGVAGGAKPTNSFAAGSAQPSGFGGRFRMSN